MLRSFKQLAFLLFAYFSAARPHCSSFFLQTTQIPSPVCRPITDQLADTLRETHLLFRSSGLRRWERSPVLFGHWWLQGGETWGDGSASLCFGARPRSNLASKASVCISSSSEKDEHVEQSMSCPIYVLFCSVFNVFYVLFSSHLSWNCFFFFGL